MKNHIFPRKMDLACRDQLWSLWRQSADFTLLAGIFDATDIHGDRVCLTRCVPACGVVCCGIANGSVKRCRMSFGLSGDPPPSDEPTRETLPVLSCRVQSTVSACCASSIRLHIIPSSSTSLKRTTALPLRVSDNALPFRRSIAPGLRFSGLLCSMAYVGLAKMAPSASH